MFFLMAHLANRGDSTVLAISFALLKTAPQFWLRFCEITDGLEPSACIIHSGGHLSACNQGDWVRRIAVSPRVSCWGCWYYRPSSEPKPSSKRRNRPMIVFVRFPRRHVCCLMTM